jgi:hypothetical protein
LIQARILAIESYEASIKTTFNMILAALLPFRANLKEKRAWVGAFPAYIKSFNGRSTPSLTRFDTKGLNDELLQALKGTKPARYAKRQSLYSQTVAQKFTI